MVTLPADVLRRYRRFTLYNSPYPAHDRGHAVDLYPETNAGVSPVAGVVRDTRTHRAPPKSYAVPDDHLVVVDVDRDWARAAGLVDGDRGDADGLVARVLHVDPAVEPGDEVAVGDSLGELVRSGYFGRWVANHVHLGFRRADQNPYRAAGSLRVDVDVPVAAVPWDGTGTVVETGPTHALLDAPAHPDPGVDFVAVAADDGTPLDGGLPHYDGGGLLGDDRPDPAAPVSLLGTEVGVADGRDVTWGDLAVLANGAPVWGLSLFAALDDGFGAKLVCPGHDFAVGDEVTVELRRRP